MLKNVNFHDFFFKKIDKSAYYVINYGSSKECRILDFLKFDVSLIPNSLTGIPHSY